MDAFTTSRGESTRDVVEAVGGCAVRRIAPLWKGDAALDFESERVRSSDIVGGILVARQVGGPLMDRCHRLESVDEVTVSTCGSTYGNGWPMLQLRDWSKYYSSIQCNAFRDASLTVSYAEIECNNLARHVQYAA